AGAAPAQRHAVGEATMATPSRNLTRGTRTGLLPAGVTAFLRRRLTECAGIALALAGAAAALALTSFHASDPSLNAATGGAARNWLGTAGAAGADLMLQTIGLAAWALPAVLVAWGWRVGTHRGLGRLWLRLALLPVTLLLATMALAGPEAAAGWSLRA